ncbi:hypothetical protein BWD09_09835 [Neisseria dentiae]|uniref:DUF4194 domain-containing protein n=1 Tax=Neisseria dentiae TaxID=194197 RepID=A0A1X3D4A8_9NEIS|nr:DUF4194 domain-containing protein [Neisseria dentiae]OSI14728.1 hypothetical protein BWD09_09835 [Neisseria dentiae]QMT44286.1 DUF4194 domain-containing protein [Neisseria dentiae]STZ49966.1 Uncharacterised protein [Neisseria dentiae]
MNWDEHDEAAMPAEAQAPDAAPAPANTLFMGDSGELPLDTRRVLVQLLAGPSLDGSRYSKLWPILVRDEAVIRKRLAELFLELVIDKDVQVAFTRQADTGELEVPLLLRRAQLTFIDSILLLHLRQRLSQADSQGDRAVVSTEEITEFLSLYERAANTDHAGFVKRVHASIEKIKKHSILQKIRASEDRFEISPTLKLLFSAEEIQALTHLYQCMAAGEMPAQLVQTEDDEGADL